MSQINLCDNRFHIYPKFPYYREKSLPRLSIVIQIRTHKMSAVTISGNPISLWFYVRGSIFEITIGRNNNVYQLKKIVKKDREPEFNTFAPDRIKLLKLKSPVDEGHISDIRNFTLQNDEEENDNIILMKDMRKIVAYWPENQ